MGNWGQVLRDKKLRATSQRLVILEAMENLESSAHHRHLTARDVFEAVQGVLPGINVTTVYRTLEGLNQVGLVDLMMTSKDQVRFSLRHSQQRHGHLVCRRCGTVDTIDIQPLARFSEEIFSQFGFRVEPDHLTLSGQCSRCLQEPHPRPGSSGAIRQEHRRHG